jgi:hypothetical protein
MLACIITIALFVNVFWCNLCNKSKSMYQSSHLGISKKIKMIFVYLCLLGSTTTPRTTTNGMTTLCLTTLSITIKCRTHLNIMLCRNAECHYS